VRSKLRALQASKRPSPPPTQARRIPRCAPLTQSRPPGTEPALVGLKNGGRRGGAGQGGAPGWGLRRQARSRRSIGARAQRCGRCRPAATQPPLHSRRWYAPAMDLGTMETTLPVLHCPMTRVSPLRLLLLPALVSVLFFLESTASMLRSATCEHSLPTNAAFDDEYGWLLLLRSANLVGSAQPPRATCDPG